MVTLAMSSFSARFALTRRTLLALTNQTFRDFQVVVADDKKGNKESGIEVLCKEFGWPFPIHYVPIEGSMEWDIGIANSMAHKTAYETGGMIAFMQGEMLLYPTVLEETVQLLEKGKDVFVQAVPSYADRVDDWQCFDLDSVFIRPQPISDFGDINSVDDNRILEIDSKHISPWNCYFAYWAENTHPDGFGSIDKGGFKHETWLGWKNSNTRCLLLESKVIHQSHFSEISWAHENLGEDIGQLGDYSEWSWLKSPFYDRWKVGEKMPIYEWRF